MLESAVLPSEEECGISVMGKSLVAPVLSQLRLWVTFEQGLRRTVLGCGISSSYVTKEQWMFLVVTRGGCSGRTRWSSLLNCSPTYTTPTVAVPYNPMVTCLFQNVLWSPDLITWLWLTQSLSCLLLRCILECLKCVGNLFPTRGSHNMAMYMDCGECEGKRVQIYKNQGQGFLLKRQVRNT